MKRTQNTMTPANLARVASYLKSSRGLRRFNNRADRLDYLNESRPNGEKLATLAPSLKNAVVTFGTRAIASVPVDDTPARTGHNVRVTKARRNADTRKAEVKHFKEKRKARVAFWDNHADKSAPDYIGLNSHNGQVVAYTAPERQYHDSISEVIESLIMGGVSIDNAVNAAFIGEDTYSQWRTDFMATAYTEKAHKAGSIRKYESKIVRLPLDTQKAIFADYESGKIDKWLAADRLGLFGNRCAKYLLKHCPEMYYAIVYGEKPHDLDDMRQDGAAALWMYEHGVTCGNGRYDLPVKVADGENSFSLVLESYGVRIKWATAEARKAFYRAIVNGLNHARGGQVSTKKAGGGRTFRFWKMVSLSELSDTENDTPESALFYENAADLYDLFGDNLSAAVLELHKAFVDKLTSDEKWVFMGMLEHGENIHALARFSGLSDYKAKKTRAEVIEKWYTYAPEYKPASKPASPAPVDFYHTRRFDSTAGKAGTTVEIKPASGAHLFWACGENNATAKAPLSVSIKSPAPVGVKAYAIAR